MHSLCNVYLLECARVAQQVALVESSTNLQLAQFVEPLLAMKCVKLFNNLRPSNEFKREKEREGQRERRPKIDCFGGGSGTPR